MSELDPGSSHAARPASGVHLALTARLNTSALDNRRGVIRLHPEAIAALGIREWDAVSLTGARTTAAVVGVAPIGTPTGTALLDDVTLSNAGLRADTSVLVAPVSVQGARSVSLSGSSLATQSIAAATLRQALLGKVMTRGDTVSLLPRDLGPGTSTTAASTALASSVGITWTSELLTVTGVDPAGPVSVQPNSLVSWGASEPHGPKVRGGDAGTSRTDEPPALPVTPPVAFDDLKGAHIQAGKLTEWLKLALENRYEAVIPNTETFLATVGRRKFVAPLFETLMEQGAWGETIAKRVYAKTRPSYHSVTQGTVDGLVLK
ncbi:MAG: leukotriene A4 hydrolase C-terminal domain-containing protein [Mycobacterium sp.]